MRATLFGKKTLRILLFVFGIFKIRTVLHFLLSSGNVNTIPTTCKQFPIRRDAQKERFHANFKYSSSHTSIAYIKVSTVQISLLFQLTFACKLYSTNNFSFDLPCFTSLNQQWQQVFTLMLAVSLIRSVCNTLFFISCQLTIITLC